MRLETEPYLNQISPWPQTGRHILAQYDDQTVVVYQAYRPESDRSSMMVNECAIASYFIGVTQLWNSL